MIIGIGGVSRAGKTSLAFKIREWIGYDDVLILHQDEFIQPMDKMPRISEHIDWEHPKSLNFESLIKKIEEAKEGNKTIIVEGLMVFWNPELLKILDHKIFLSIRKETFLSRKTLDNRWGDEPDWYIQHIWDSHFIYGLLPEGEPNVLQLDGEACCTDEAAKDFLNLS